MLQAKDSPPELQAHLEELALRIRRHTPHEGIHTTAVPGLRLMRATQVSEPMHTVHQPALCVVAQGAKTTTLAGESYRYDPANYLVTSVHLPMVGRVTEASPELPYLSLQLDFDTDAILDMGKEIGRAPQGKTDRGIWRSESSAYLLEAMLRLVRLLDTPEDIPVLAPLAVREILYRVLQGEQGVRITSFAWIGSHAHGIAQVIRRIKKDFDRTIPVDELAEEAHMSPSALFKHFKRVTAMSPLQYQKVIRLQEARRLLMAEGVEAADAGFRVGYESPSQFSREYARMFGQPPIRDMKAFKDFLT